MKLNSGICLEVGKRFFFLGSPQNLLTLLQTSELEQEGTGTGNNPTAMQLARQ